MPAEHDLHHAQALLVEGNAMLRSVAINQLREAGIGDVTAVSRLRDARLALERQRFDVVLCCREFEGEAESGQDLLDELRRERLLSHSTVFLMVTQRAVYHQVVEAGEAALDGLLLRPYSTAALHQRLQEARQRKRELAPILRALDAGETERTFALALQHFQQGAPYANWCGRLAAELLLDLRRPHDARLLFEKLYAARQQAWAQLGMARALAAAGDIGGARRLIEPMLAKDASLADAHDLHGRLLLEQGDFEAALSAYRQASELTPGCLLRAQHAGALAYYQGHRPGHKDEARRRLEQSLNMGLLSRLFDPWSLLLLALLRYDAAGGVAALGQAAAHNAAAAIAPLREQLQRLQKRHPESPRLQRLAQAIDWLHALAAGSLHADAAAQAGERAHRSLATMGEDAGAEDFDFEAANTWLALWARLPEHWRNDALHLQTIRQLALRFSHGRATTEALCGAAERDPAALAAIRAAQAEVQAQAEEAMAKSLRNEPEAAVRQLLDAGIRLCNVKLLDMALAVIRRQPQVNEVLQRLLQQAQQALERCGPPSTHIAGIERAGRSAPGLRLRAPVALAA